MDELVEALVSAQSEKEQDEAREVLEAQGMQSRLHLALYV